MADFGVATNMDHVMAKLRLLPGTYSMPVMEQMVMAGAAPIAVAARRLAPVRRGGNGGTLRRAIHHRLEPGAQLGSAVAVVTWRAGTASRHDAFHGVFSELGTGPRLRKGGGSTGSMPARPFMRPAYDQEHGRARRNAEAVLLSSVMRLAI